MVAAFICPCHGIMKLTDAEWAEHKNHGLTSPVAYVELAVCKDNYWTQAKLVKQLEDVIRIFDILHPGAQALFLFDNSSNHHAKAPNGLCADNHNLSDGGKNAPEGLKAVVYQRKW